MSKAEVDIVVTHFKTPAILNECLTRIMSYPSHRQVFVVDSGNDGTVEHIKNIYPNIQAFSVLNHSMANTVNEGLKRTTADYILQMNADVYLRENSISDMLNILKQTKVGMVGPICFNQSHKPQNQGLLYYRYYHYLNLTRQSSVKTNWLSGCCNLIKREALLEVGGLNSSLRFYNEDIEWGWRFNKAGWQTHLVNTPVTHLGGSSTPNDPKFIIEGFRGGYKLSQWYRGKLYQAAHRFFVKLELNRAVKDKAKKQAYNALKEMFLKETFDSSPFAETLNSTHNLYETLLKP